MFVLLFSMLPTVPVVILACKLALYGTLEVFVRMDSLAAPAEVSSTDPRLRPVAAPRNWDLLC